MRTLIACKITGSFRANMRKNIVSVLCQISMKEHKQLLIMDVFVTPKVSLVFSELTASIKKGSGE
jgi:hypothetical protein